MAEILLSLTIIGVVAAITLPSLTGNINERTWNLDSEYRLPTKEDLAALVINKNIVGNLTAPRYVSSSFTSNASNMWYLHVPTIGCYHMEWGDVDVSIRCVKR